MEICGVPFSQGKKKSGRAFLSLAVFLSMTLTGAVIGSKPAAADPFTPSVADQIKLGDQAAAQTDKQYHVIYDQRADRMNRVGQNLLNALGSDRGPWHWKFHLIDSKEVNAFALPGGNIYFFTGLFNQLQTDDQIAAVMGHEMTHVRKQHWAHEYADQQKRQMGFMVLLNLAHASRSLQSLASVGNSLFTLKFSRGEEEQADLGGLDNMRRAHYNLNGMLELFQVLQKSGGGGTPEFLSDHPLTNHRITAARKEMVKMGVQPEM